MFPYTKEAPPDRDASFSNSNGLNYFLQHWRHFVAQFVRLGHRNK